jgi:glutamate dehydrogenase
VSLHEREQVRVFLRDDAWGRYVSAIVYMPRDRFDTTVRKRISALLYETLAAERVDFLCHARRVAAGAPAFHRPHAGRHPLPLRCRRRSKGQVARIVRGWSDELKQNLVGHYGEERGNRLLRRYSPELPCRTRSGSRRLRRCPTSTPRGRRAERPVEVKLSAAQGDDGAHQHLKLFRRGRPRPLSAILPVLENMGLTVLLRAAVQPAQE